MSWSFFSELDVQKLLSKKLLKKKNHDVAKNITFRTYMQYYIFYDSKLLHIFILYTPFKYTIEVIDAIVIQSKGHAVNPSQKLLSDPRSATMTTILIRLLLPD